MIIIVLMLIFYVRSNKGKLLVVDYVYLTYMAKH